MGNVSSLGVAVLLVLQSSLMSAQVRSDSASRIARAVRTNHPPKIDGNLDDPVWQTAPPVDDLRQKEPLETQPATERTEVRILYDSRHIYFGVHCYDSDPAAIVATQLRRDLPQALDDNFAILIDPTLSRRNAYIFQVNALGTQFDGEVIEEQAPAADNTIVDPSWDGLWLSAAKITADGWTATIEIPFSTLNFGGGRTVSWGLNFRRFIRRKNEEDEWAGYRHIFGFWRASQAGTLEGLTEIENSHLLVLKPYGLIGGKGFQGQSWSALHRGGGEVKYGLTSELIAVGTANTDFSDADVDQQQFNLTPFPIFVPEKRRFFLENSDVFAFPLWGSFTTYDLLFFTRQIGVDPASGQEVPIDGGGKIAGHIAGMDLGVMDVRTRRQDVIPSANYSIIRLKRPLMAGSYIGFIATDKESGSSTDPYNRSGGLDARFTFFQNLNLRGYYAKTWSPGLPGDNAAFGGQLIYANSFISITAGHGVTERNFNPETGFVTRTDDAPTLLDTTLTPRPHKHHIRELHLSGTLINDPNTAGHLVYRQAWPAVDVVFENGALVGGSIQNTTWQVLTKPLHLYKNISIPIGSYRFDKTQLWFYSAGNHRFTYQNEFKWGSYFAGTFKTLISTAEYRPNSHFDFLLNNTLDVFRLPQGNFDVDVAGVQLSYAFTRFLNTSTFVQVDTAQTKALSASFRLRYTFRPDSDLFVIYNLGSRFQALTTGNPMTVREQRFAVKVTYSWSPR